MLPPYFRFHHDSASCPNHKAYRWTESSEDDRLHLLPRHSPYRYILQLELGLQQPPVSVSECCFHSDVEGRIATQHTVLLLIDCFKGTAPIAVLLATWCLKLGRPNFKVFVNMVVIVIGIVIASFGEIKFKLNGFLYQMGGVLFEAFRLALIQRLLSSEKYKMDPLVSLYFFAPVCAAMIFILALVFEMPSANWKDLSNVGYWVILANASIAFLLNVASVFLVSD